MITKKISTQIAVRQDGFPCTCYDYYGKSSDTKPVDGANNADLFYEMDTKKVFLFDAENGVWLEQ